MNIVEVRKSSIVGKGVYAGKAISKGSLIFVVKGYVHRFHPSDSAWTLFHAVSYAPHKWINPHPNNPLRYTNHSCKPNAILTDRLKIMALRDIRVGEEITIDYSLTENDNKYLLTCRCGHSNCRRDIKDIHHTPAHVINKYKRFIPKWLLKSYDNQRNSKKNK